jgi:hypothetical protein
MELKAGLPVRLGTEAYSLLLPFFFFLWLVFAGATDFGAIHS